MPEYTFGWESEFATNVPALVMNLRERGLLGMDEMHRYHCECGMCAFENGFPFRAQTDSSCGGEVISDIMCDVDEARDYMSQLQEAAVDVDAEPSLDAGLHVHVGVSGRTTATRARFLWNYLRWENVLGQLVAPGRWPEMRENNYQTLRGLANIRPMNREQTVWLDSEERMPWHGREALRNGIGTPSLDPIWWEDRLGSNEREMAAVRGSYYDAMFGMDRHVWINVQTREHNTFEFRLWNATRVAWRMEMYARTSLLFVNMEARDDLGRTEPTWENLLDLAGTHDENLVPLLLRQHAAPATHDPFTGVASGPPTAPAEAAGLAPDVSAGLADGCDCSVCLNRIRDGLAPRRRAHLPSRPVPYSGQNYTTAATSRLPRSTAASDFSFFEPSTVEDDYDFHGEDYPPLDIEE